MSKTSQLPIVLLLVFLVPLWALSDKRLCADPKCSKTISMGRGKVNYRNSGEGLVSFMVNAKISIMSKSAGSDPSYWGITVAGRQGYAPKSLIEETKILISSKDLKFEVPVILPGSPAVDSTPVLKTSERIESTPSVFSDAATAPLNVPSTSGDDQPHAISKNILENSTVAETPVATQVQPAIQVIDGTALPLLDEQPKTAPGAVLQDIATAPKTTTSELEQATATTLSTKSDDDKRNNDNNENKEEAPTPVKSSDTPPLKDEIAKTYDDHYDKYNADDGDDRPGADAGNTTDTQATTIIAGSVKQVERALLKETTQSPSVEQSLEAAKGNNPDMKMEKASDGIKTETNAAETVESLAKTSSTDADTNPTNHEAKPEAGSEIHVIPKPFNAGINAPDTDGLSVKDAGSLKAELPIVDNGVELNEKSINEINNIPNEQTENNNKAKSDDEKPKTSGLGSDVKNASAPKQAQPQPKESAPHSQEADSESSPPEVLNIPETATNASDSLNSDHTDEIVASAANGDSVRHTVTPAVGVPQMQMLHPPQEEKEAMTKTGATPDHEAILEPKMESPKQDSAALSEEQTTTATPAYTYHQPTRPSHMETDGRQIYAHDHHYNRVPPVHTYNANPTQETSTTPHYAATGDTATARDGDSTNTIINAAEQYHSHTQHDDSKPTQHAYSLSLKTTTSTAPAYAHHPADGWDSASVPSNAKAAQQHSVLTESALTGTTSPPAVHDHYLAEGNNAEQQHSVTERAPIGTSLPPAPANHGRYIAEGHAPEQQHSVPEGASTGTTTPSAPADYGQYPSTGNAAEQQHSVTESAPTATATPSAPADYGRYPSAVNAAEQQHSVTESVPTSTASAPYGDSTAANINTKSADHYPTAPTHESSKINSMAKAPLQTDEPKERGLFATILGTVDTFWSNVKREVRDVAEKEHLALLEDVEPGENIWHRATDEGGTPVHGDSVGGQAAYCYAASDGQAIGSACDNYGSGNSHRAVKSRLTLNEVLEVLTAKMLEMSELLSCLGIAAVSSLLFVFGYYCFCNNNNEGALLSKLNHMERTLISAQKENLILRDETQQIGSQLTTILGDSSEVMGSASAVSVDNFELEGLLHENEQQRANIRVLEKELEEATESGLELNKMLAEMLSTQESTNVSAALENQVSELEGLLETQRSEVHHEYNARLADKDREIGELQLIQAEQSARMRSEILSLQRDNDELETEKSNLEGRLLEARHEIESSIAKHSAAHGAEVAVLHNEIRDLKQQWESEHGKLQTSLAKVEALEECLKYIKRDPSVNINEVINTANILAEINDLKKKRGTLTSKLDNETQARRLAEDQLQVVMDEVEKLKQHFHSAEKDKLEAQTRLEVLSNYFREKETQLQKELSLKEAMWLKKQGETTSTVDRLTTMQDEIQSLKSQNDELRAEIEAQLAAHKAQTGTLERRSHENWLEARHSERRYNEARAEAATLRQKLTALAGSNDLSRNFETAPSPIQMESPGSPMLGALPPPFLPPPPFMGGMPPPYMNMPPFVPPMPRSMPGGYDYYDDFEEDDDEEDEDEYDSPPHRRRNHDSWNRRDSYSRSRHRDRERYRSPSTPTAGPTTHPHASGSSVA